MENKLCDIFDKIHAGDTLKQKTAGFLAAEIQRRGQRRRMAGIRIAAVCAAFVLVIMAGIFSYNLYITPSAFVDMDVNPSVELTLNRFGRVLEANPYNDDGAGILRDIDVKNKTYEQAIQTLLGEMIQQGYLGDDSLVSVTVQADGGAAEETMLRRVQASVDASLGSQLSTISQDIFAVSSEVRKCAHDYNLSPAKYLAITHLQEVDPTATYEGCAEHSISEIRQYTEEHGGNHEGEHHETSPGDSTDVTAGGNPAEESEDCEPEGDLKEKACPNEQHKNESDHHEEE